MSYLILLGAWLYASRMVFDASPHSLAAVAIRALFWWTVLSPLGLLAVAVLCASRLRLRAALTLVVLAPPMLVFLPVAVMHGGFAGPGAAGAALLAGVGILLAAVALVRAHRRPELAARYAVAAVAFGAVGGMLGSGALVGALIFA
jgi:hypothetical protein